MQRTTMQRFRKASLTCWMMALLLLALGALRPAWAGHWEAKCEVTASKGAWEYSQKEPYGEQYRHYKGPCGNYITPGEASLTVNSKVVETSGPFINGHIRAAVTAHFKLQWKRGRDPYTGQEFSWDNPPKTLYYREVGGGSAEALVSSSSSSDPLIVEGILFDGVGGQAQRIPGHITQVGSRLGRVKVDQDGMALLPSRTLGGDIFVPECQSTSGGQFRINVGYSILPIQNSIYVTLEHPLLGLAGNDIGSPDYKEIAALVGLNWKNQQDPELPLLPFWQGAATFSVWATLPNSELVYNPAKYHWSASRGEGTSDTQESEVPFKDYAWDFGQDLDALPQTTTMRAAITNADGANPIMTKAVLHWHSAWEGAETNGNSGLAVPFGGSVTVVLTGEDGSTSTVTKPVSEVQVGELIVRPDAPDGEAGWTYNVTQVEPQPDGTTLVRTQVHFDPEDDPDRPGYDETQQIKKIQAAYKQAIHDGAEGVKLGLEAYVELAKWPYYEVRGAAFNALTGKAVNLLRIGAEASGLANRAQAAAARLKVLTTRLRGLLGHGRSTGEAAELEAKIKELEQVTTKLERGAEDLEAFALQSKKVGKDAEVIGEAGEAAEHTVAPGSVRREQATQDVLREIDEAGVMIHSDAEAERYLDYSARMNGENPANYNATTLGNDIFIRPAYAQNVRVLREELVHVFQQRAGHSSAQAVEAEIKARLEIIRNRYRWAITNEEIREIIRETRIMLKNGAMLMNEDGIPKVILARHPELPAIEEALAQYRAGHPVTAVCYKCGHLLTVGYVPEISTWVTCPNGCTRYHESYTPKSV